MKSLDDSTLKKINGSIGLGALFIAFAVAGVVVGITQIPEVKHFLHTILK